MNSSTMPRRATSQTIFLTLLLAAGAFTLIGCGGTEPRVPPEEGPLAASDSQASSEETAPVSVIEQATSSFPQPGGSWKLTCGYPGHYYRQTVSGTLMFETICRPKNPSQIVYNNIKAFSCNPWCLWNDNGALRCGRC